MMKFAIVIVCLLIALIAAVNADPGQRSRGGKHRGGSNSRANGEFSIPFPDDIGDIFNSIWGTLNSGDSTFSIGTDDGSWVVESSISGSSDPPPSTVEETSTVPDEEVVEIAPWRGEGSFTGDVRILCRGNNRCSKGPVQVYNKEKESWGFLCGDDWGIEESDVVCKYLQFPEGAAFRSRFRLNVIRQKFNTSAPIVWKSISCTGEEPGIISCGGTVFQEGDICPQNRIAGVKCAGKRINTDTIQTCDESQFACGNGAVCLPLNYQCDELADCPWGTDEMMCGGNMCPENQFDCGSGGSKECVINAFRCDGDDDCGNGNDEDGCDDYLSHFTALEGEKITARGSQSGWRHISPYSCAEKCLEETNFKCVAFMYDKDERECDLSSLAPPDVSTFVPFNQAKWVTYIRRSETEDCAGHQCDSQCLADSDICDGINDCVDESDEQDCNEVPTIELRIAGGRSKGQLEAKFRNGQWGLVCSLGWSTNEANVACRQLGYRYAAGQSSPGTSRSSLPHVLSGVDCVGTESNLNECSHNAANFVLCIPDYNVWVDCMNSATTPSSSTASTSSTTTTPPTVSATTPERPPVVTPTISQCGLKPPQQTLASTRIVGGNNAIAHEFPWQAGLWLSHPFGDFFKCGGTIISSCWILTAAHCFNNPNPIDQYIIRLGDHFAAPKEKDRYQVDFGIKQYIVYGGYNKVTNDNDIALIKLKQGSDGQCANLTSMGLAAACLPTSPNQFTAPKTCVITGWGQLHEGGRLPYAPQLKKANVDLISQSVCENLPVYRNRLTDNMFCAGELKGGTDTCQGDSGGPLACKDDSADIYYVWGVVSWGNGCARANAPGIYTVVANYVSWIQGKIG